MSDQDAAPFVKIVYIKQMTIDLFQFWLDFDLPSILWGIHLLQPPTKTHTKERAPFLRSLRILWKSDSNSEINHLTDIVWAQVSTDTIHVEFTNDGELSNELSKWLSKRFDVGTPKGDALKISNVPSQELTPTETKVASYLAKRMTYKQIGELLGKRSEHAARKHAQSLARKWGTKQFIEGLWDEAKKRGFDTP